MNKEELRKQIKAQTEGFSGEYINSASERICSRIINLPEFNNAKTVFVYVSLPLEPQTKAVIEKAWELNKTVCVPKCINQNEMIAVNIKRFDDLRPAKFGISEPVSERLNISKEKIELAIIPCVSADKNGTRLGHGGGYYDRFLYKAEIKKFCLCFEKNICEKIPTDKNDILMDGIVTECNIYVPARENKF